ncbi:hypothetical protein i14_4364 [Escherichia coli str. 'clone D i14']|uniref:Uncharacterized protein n=2 Tax=Escherichia coli TaxID=562 RepID=Q2XQ53_ECOLX|nr:Hypothetical protein c4770 [Escherichia coli CFT073]ABB71182.1 hypothetical protein [Escherichia coli]AER86885.1 hypothetical protein i02_4364 [Escherichia coli str. 'clone D i2']AER91804.1 hypothetical protein i14_4364 [Escherichia coli str. 'clone D i14']EFJ62509.1 hypothetical protein HMPREF9553_01375 [Escherichia coli MS 200-1]EFU60038.1 hypothetical protein HMPREF9545_00116 [Escherichia coli MS 16-3]
MQKFRCCAANFFPVLCRFSPEYSFSEQLDRLNIRQEIYHDAIHFSGSTL